MSEHIPSRKHPTEAGESQDDFWYDVRGWAGAVLTASLIVTLFAVSRTSPEGSMPGANCPDVDQTISAEYSAVGTQTEMPGSFTAEGADQPPVCIPQP